ncbi:hypothetical protein AB4427_14595 [Vibrio artabrorum]|uniref:hypothetical protein n=1 Tax=Vibrio artabrorum TaxID=446374 RepID=UPI00354F1A46
MNYRKLLPFLLFTSISMVSQAYAEPNINGFVHFTVGGSDNVENIAPNGGGIIDTDNGYSAVASFRGIQESNEYGEMWFPIDPNSDMTKPEPNPVDLTGSNFAVITYKSNAPAILQLRQWGVHGGNHNMAKLPNTFNKVSKLKLNFSDFKDWGGNHTLDLSSVAKFNIAFLTEDKKTGTANIVVTGFTISNYNPTIK